MPPPRTATCSKEDAPTLAATTPSGIDKLGTSRGGRIDDHRNEAGRPTTRTLFAEGDAARTPVGRRRGQFRPRQRHWPTQPTGGGGGGSHDRSARNAARPKDRGDG